MHVVNAIQSAVGMAKSLAPIGPGKVFPLVPKAPDIESFMAGFFSLLQGILGSSTPQSEDVDISKNIGLQGKEEDTQADSTQELPNVEEDSGPSRNADAEDLQSRDDEDRDAEKKPDDLSVENLPVSMEQIRQILSELDPKAVEAFQGTAPDPARMIEQIMQALKQLRPEAGPQTNVAPRTAPSAAPETPALPKESAPVSFERTLKEAVPQVKPVVLPTAAPKPEAASLPPVGVDKALALKVQEAPVFAPDADVDAPAPLSNLPPLALQAAGVTEASVRGETASRESRDTAVRAVGEVRSSEGSPSRGSAAAEASSSAEERAEFIDRILKAARLAQSRGGARIKIALNPPHLGNLKVDLSVRQHVLNGTLQAENVGAKDLILANLRSLKESLEDQGIQVGEFTVKVENSFEQTQREARRERAPEEAPRFAGASLSEEPLSPVESRLRSARLQLVDLVA